MPKSVLLINPPVIEEHTLNTQPIPLGVISIAAYLRQKGHFCQIINLCGYNSWDKVKKKLCTQLEVDYVGIPCFTRQRFSVAKLAKLIKSLNPNLILWLGGPHVTFLDKAVLREYEFVDCIIRGEGEETAAALVSNSLSLEQIEGLTFRNERGEIVRNQDREMASPLERFPVPLQSLDELEELNQSDSLLFHFPVFPWENLKIAPLISSRGCNGNCSFCCNRAYWGNQRSVNLEFLKAQVEYYYQKGICFFDCYDDNFTWNRNLVLDFAEYIIREKIAIHWWCSSRADSVDVELLRKMKQAGCFMVSYGMESGSQIILNNIKKGISVARILEAAKMAEEVGLNFRVTISIGHTGETDGTIQETIDVLNMMKPKQIALFVLKVYPGTPIYKKMVQAKLLSDDYWFHKDVPIVPFFTIENSEQALIAYRERIESGLHGAILERYEDELGSVELTLDWG